MFKLKLPEGWIIYNVFNEDLLIWYREPQFREQYMELASIPDIINKEEEYEVEETRKYRKQECSIQFLVHWKGYGNEYN